MAGGGHRHELIDRPFDDAAAILLDKRRLVQMVRIGAEESYTRPQKRKAEKAVAEECLESGSEIQIGDAQGIDDLWEEKNDQADGHEYQAECREGPGPVSGVDDVEHLDEMITAHRGASARRRC